jgi:hypothetical protein
MDPELTAFTRLEVVLTMALVLDPTILWLILLLRLRTLLFDGNKEEYASAIGDNALLQTNKDFQ